MKPDRSTASLLADLTGGDEERAEAAALRLAGLGEAALPALEELLRSADADQRWWALRTIGQFAAPPVELLLRGLEDGSADVRAAAALALAAHPAGQAAPALAAAIRDEDNLVGMLAVNALVAIGKPAVPVLLEAYPASNPRGRIQTMRALADIRDPRSIPLMMKAIEEQSALLRFWAEQGLERLGLDMVYIKPE